MEDGIERKLLQKMSESLVVRKSELIEHVRGRSKDPKKDVDEAVLSLLAKKWIVPVYSSETTFAITQKGMKEMRFL